MAKVLKISRKELHKRLQISGLNVLSPALTLLESELLNAFPSYDSIDDFIRQFTDVLVINHKLEWFLVDSQTAQQVIDEMRERRISRTTDNELIVKNVVNSNVINLISNKTYLQHLTQLSKHLERHPIFKSSNFKLTKIDSLITSSEDSIECIVFGFLMKDLTKINEYVIEDNSGKVPILLTDETQFREPLIVENSFVLIEGIYYSSKDTLRVEAIGNPPPIDLNSTIDLSNSLQRTGRMVVIISDIHLDDNKTLDKLKTLFTGYDSMVPIPDCFVFVGDFMSKRYNHFSDFKAHMKSFVKMISKFNKISESSQFIFVPGFDDIDGKDIPKLSFSVEMFPHSTTKLHNYYLATNPVNIYIDGRHICLSAVPYLSRLQKHMIHENTEDVSELVTSLAKLICCNSHLNVGLTKSLDSCLSLFHLPDVLLFADNHIDEDIDGNAFNYVNVIKMPSFSRDGYKFKVFYTNPKLIESSQILV